MSGQLPRLGQREASPRESGTQGAEVTACGLNVVIWPDKTNGTRLFVSFVSLWEDDFTCLKV
jgi:hypothetical protein